MGQNSVPFGGQKWVFGFSWVREGSEVRWCGE